MSDQIVRSKNNILIGELRIGKSTIVNKVLATMSSFRGLFCHKVFEEGEIVGYELLDENEISLGVFAHTSLPSHIKFGPFACDLGVFEQAADYIERLMREPCDLFVIDEIGLMERQCISYLSAVNDLLESEIPTLLIVQKRADYFIAGVKTRSDCLIFEATRENRELLPNAILDHLHLP